MCIYMIKHIYDANSVDNCEDLVQLKQILTIFIHNL